MALANNVSSTSMASLEGFRADQDPVTMALHEQGDKDEPIPTCQSDNQYATLATSMTDSNVKRLADDQAGSTLTGAATDGVKELSNSQSPGSPFSEEKPKKRRTVHANMHTLVDYTGQMIYHIPINSALGEQYRTLTSKAEKVAFYREHGRPEPFLNFTTISVQKSV
ncbi:hypothetical protein PG993_000811 [Apiospora rasikravindrae]|uniref:Uncharacterized protein n=1 Tax=Apiospora rasikravindrae TaxID=990691 RepID=A0ABR1U9N3_9PEZI